METAEMVSKIQEVSRDVCDIDDLEVTAETVLSAIEGWDSFTKINLFSSLEKEFSVKFTIADMGKMNTVSEIIAIVREKK